MISCVISKTAVTPWMAQESNLSGNQTVYRRRQADLQPLRWNSTSAARRELAPPQATTEGRPVATYRNKAMLQRLPKLVNEFGAANEIGGGQYGKNGSWFV